jgi:heme exporter protein D
MNHTLFVTAAYVVSALGLGFLALWILADQRARKKELADLEAAGVTRRSARKSSRVAG